jgi:transposase
MPKDTTGTAGIDTGKDTLDAAVHGTESRFKVDNAEPGWRKLAADLADAGVSRIGIEATGGYERGVTRYLQAQGSTVLVREDVRFS